MTSRGQFCAGAREVPSGARVSKTIDKVRFLEVQGGENSFFLLGTSKIYENGPREAGNPPNRPSRIQRRNTFYNPFVWPGPRSSKVGYFDVK